MKLAYLELDLGSAGPPAVVLHREGITSTVPAVEFARESGLFGRVVVPTGEYAFYPSGMSIGGTCWYRVLPGFEGTDPISLTTAVVEVADLIADVALDQPVLVGWGQGAVVALAAALWRPGSVRSVVCVDAPRAHVDLLPRAVLDAPSPPPVLLAATDGPRRAELGGLEEFLTARLVATTTWQWAGEGTPRDLDEALADQIGKWMGQARHAQ